MASTAFDYFRDSYAESMENMFAAVSDLYARYWGDFFHFAIFEDLKETREAALERTHERYATDLQVRKAARALDLACGRGGWAEYMAHACGGTVLGVDISEAQLSAARRRQLPNLTFARHDIMLIDELDERFDAVSFLDAACYLPDKELAVRKIRQVMNPGARLLIVEWCKQDGVNSFQEELVLHPFMKAWAVPSLETARRYERFFKRAGLRVLKIEDLNDRVGPNWELGYWNGLQALKELSMKDLPHLVWKGLTLGPKALELIKDQFTAAVYIKCGFDAGFLRYTYFLVENPGTG